MVPALVHRRQCPGRIEWPRAHAGPPPPRAALVLVVATWPVACAWPAPAVVGVCLSRPQPKRAPHQVPRTLPSVQYL